MSTKIEWTQTVNPDGTITKGETWNPIRARNKATAGVGHYCQKVSAGCRACYAERMQAWRFKNPIRFGEGDFDKVEIYLDEKVLLKPLSWKKPRKIFVCDMSDLFGHWVKQEWIDKIFAIMKQCPHLTFQVLTKRPELMLRYFNSTHLHSRLDNTVIEMMRELPGLKSQPCYMQTDGVEGWPLPNVWLGTSCENQATADDRIPYLLQVPAAVRFLSCEPLIGPIDLIPPLHYPIPGTKDYTAPIDWVIVGGESGSKARPMHPDWARDLRDQCEALEIPFFFKQWGEWSTEKLFPGKRKNISGTYLNKAGNRCGFKSLMDGNPNYETMYKTGKHLSGNQLDGKVHQAFPETEKKLQSNEV